MVISWKFIFNFLGFEDCLGCGVLLMKFRCLSWEEVGRGCEE